MKNLKQQRKGKFRTNNKGLLMFITEYNSANDIEVTFFRSECRVRTTYTNFMNRLVKDPLDRTVWGVGCVGVGKYKPTDENGKQTPNYVAWSKMLQRCYSSSFHKIRPTYVDCTVCEEWLNFQTFSDWYFKNYYQIDGQIMCLDKDILVSGNRVYSPQTCIFAPISVNTAFARCKEFDDKISYLLDYILDMPPDVVWKLSKQYKQVADYLDCYVCA